MLYMCEFFVVDVIDDVIVVLGIGLVLVVIEVVWCVDVDDVFVEVMFMLLMLVKYVMIGKQGEYLEYMGYLFVEMQSFVCQYFGVSW